MASSDSQIDKPHRGRPKRAELPDVNINTGAQSVNTERASLRSILRLSREHGEFREFVSHTKPYDEEAVSPKFESPIGSHRYGLICLL